MSNFAVNGHVYVPDRFPMDGHHRIVEAGFYLRMGKTVQNFASLINGHCSSGTFFPSQSLASLKRGDLCSSNEQSTHDGT